MTHEVHKTALTVLAVLPTPQKVYDSSFLKYIWALQLLLVLSLVSLLSPLLSTLPILSFP